MGPLVRPYASRAFAPDGSRSSGGVVQSTSDLIGRFSGALDGTVALVTGAGSGIGYACARAFAGSGADVGLLGRRAANLERAAEAVLAVGRRAVPLVVDVTDPVAVERAVSQLETTLGPADIGVASAGTNAWADLDDLSPEQLREALRTNVEGVANLAHAVVPGMRSRGWGKLIVVASDNGRRPESGGSAYVASKFGAVGFALSLSQELYASGVSVHVLEPGCVDTDWYPPDEDAPRERMLAADDVAYMALVMATLPADIVLEESMLLPRGLLRDPW
jgi:3-oxoacyl-[acyl-carrier protein] reductase